MNKKTKFLQYNDRHDLSFPIDLVYLWIDGSSPEFRNTKAKYLRAAGKDTNKYVDATKDQIFCDNDELKYSLRSVEQNAPWVNHIYIVTGFGQVPNWLNTDNPRVTIIPQESILPQGASPIFNSCAIEACLANIPGLVEHFLLANDDMFFNAPTSPAYFFDANGRAKFRAIYRKNGHIVRDNHSVYLLHLINAAAAIEKAFGVRLYDYKASHGIDPYIKSSMQECYKNPILAKYINTTRRNRFRDETDVHRLMFNLYDVIYGRAKIIRSHSKHNGHNIILDCLYNLIHYKSVHDSAFYCTDAVESGAYKSNAKIMCINDSWCNSLVNKQHNRKFFDTKFPYKSDLEK
ncbi:MAG: Stealth CR1 domain-containing protein [Alphaproteobacteria bacterium]|jgi:hypothetical protein|nr:Stealth CR1 domain-containing protein [Alphaproteobacteria bacterium]